MIEKISLGSTGFAQVGDPDYYDKQRVEGSYLLRTLREAFKEKLAKFNASLHWVANPHDFGTYHDLEIWCNIDAFPEDQQDEVWDFINEMEGIDWENPELYTAIKEEYEKDLVNQSKSE